VPLVAALSLLLAACCGTKVSDEELRPDTQRSSGSAASAGPVAGPVAAPAAAVGAGVTWGEPNVAWRAPAEGLAEAKRTGKPVLLVLFTTWCSHCKNYQRIFADPRIAERAKSFVMIRADADKEEALATRYAPDGGYIPRTFFLKPDGTLLADIRANTGKFGYFFDENRAEPLLAAMERAQASTK
jgi:thiol:disulfide interchange protein